MDKKIKWKKGLERNISAQEVHTELERIKADGRLTPEAIVSAAEPDGAPLHSCFCWDKEKNHRAHLLWQARQLVSSIEIEIIQDDAPAITHREYVTVVHEGLRSYESIDVVLQSDDLRPKVIADALTDIERTVRKYSALYDLASLIGATMREINTLRTALLKAQALNVETVTQ